MSRGPFSLAVAAAVVALVAPAAFAQRSGTPDPCSAVSTGAVNRAFGASSDTQEFGTPGSKTVHGVTIKSCTWTYGNAELVVSIAPKAAASHPPAFPAGTKTRKVTGFGTSGKLATNTRPGSAFNAVSFTKGPHWAQVWGSATVPSASVLKLGRALYLKL